MLIHFRRLFLLISLDSSEANLRESQESRVESQESRIKSQESREDWNNGRLYLSDVMATTV